MGALEELSEFWGEEYFVKDEGVVCNSYDEWFAWAQEDPTRVIHPADRKYLEEWAKREGKSLEEYAPKLLQFANGQLWGKDLKKRPCDNCHPSIPHAYFGNTKTLGDIRVVILGINPSYGKRESHPSDYYETIVKHVNELLFDRPKDVYPWAEDRKWVENNTANEGIARDFDWHKRYMPANFKGLWETETEINSENILQLEFFPYPSLKGFKDLDKEIKCFENPSSGPFLPSQEKVWNVMKELLQQKNKQFLVISTIAAYNFCSSRCSQDSNLDDSHVKYLKDFTLLPRLRGLPSSLDYGQYMTAKDYSDDICAHVKELVKKWKSPSYS